MTETIIIDQPSMKIPIINVNMNMLMIFVDNIMILFGINDMNYSKEHITPGKHYDKKPHCLFPINKCFSMTRCVPRERDRLQCKVVTKP